MSRARIALQLREATELVRARIYHILYLKDLDKWRSLVWFTGMGTILVMMGSTLG